MIFLLVFRLTNTIFQCFFSVHKRRSKRGLLNTWQRIKGTVMASSYCAHCSASQLKYYDLLITCSAASVFYNGPEAESGVCSGLERFSKSDSCNCSPYAYQTQKDRTHQYLLHGHLGHHIKSGKVSVGKVVFVLAHLDGIQPLVHSAEAGEVWDAAVQEREMNTEGDTSRID